MTEPNERVTLSRKAILLATVLSALGTFGITALLMNIFERKQEAREPFFRAVNLTDEISDPAEWGKNFPQQYQDYLQTVDMERTRFGGSEAVPREPTADDPRTATSRSNLERVPDLKRMWAGYAFAHDFREKRGHAYMLEDQLFTGRQDVVKQPGTCLHCHASTYNAYKKLGNGDLTAGFEKLNQMPYSDAVQHVAHPVTCIDCHEPESMQLRITRPSFMEGIAQAKAAAGIEKYDVNTQATHQEMRTFVCAQCHVEYYFKGSEKRLTYPWSKGLRADEILAYYDEVGFKDWTHAETGAPMLKAQHPEFELWSQGIHARSGVTCADCHMPYHRVGAMKVSDHHIRSPLLNINRACQTCHNVPESELKFRVETIQERTVEMTHLALDALVDLIDSIVAAKAAGASEETLNLARDHQRQASFYLDFVEAENSSGFHADQEAMRVLGLALNHCRLGEKALRDTPVEKK